NPPARDCLSRSPVCRELQVHAPVFGLAPAPGHHLAAGVEAEAVGAVDVGFAEERVLPAAEGVVGHRHGDGNGDADHADLDVLLETARDAAVVREDGRPIAVGVALTSSIASA